MLLVDRTRIEADWTCPRKRYWLTEYQHRGIVPLNTPKPLAVGIVVHEGLEKLTSCHLKLEEREKGARPPLDHMTTLPEWKMLDQDQQWLAQALVIGFGEEVWPQWVDQYEKVGIEQELEFEHEGVLYMCRPDILLRERKTGDLWYPDFKTYGAGWSNRKWAYALQQHLTILACEKATGEKIIGSWIQGLAKGTRRASKMYHPLVYAYRKHGSPGLYTTAYAPKRRPGFERFPVVEYEGEQPKRMPPQSGAEAIRGWIRMLRKRHPEIVSNLFPRTQPIFLKREMMDEFLTQRTKREKEIGNAVDMTPFPQTFSACESTYGTCPYLDACWVPTVNRDPIKSGLYVKRTPHHEAERTVLRVSTKKYDFKVVAE